MSFSNVVHHFTRNPETKGYRITKITPLTRLSNLGEFVFLQEGKFWSADGVEMKTVPGWAYDQMAKLTERTLKEAGFSAPVAKPKDAPQWLDPETVEFKKAELEDRRRNSRR